MTPKQNINDRNSQAVKNPEENFNSDIYVKRVFYFDDFGTMQTFFKTFFHGMGEWSGFEVKQAITGNLWLWIVALILCMPVRTWAEQHMQNQTAKYAIRTVLSIIIIFLSVSLLVGATNNAFLYFRF